MPELPEVESARAVIEREALGRVIADVDDSDTYVSRPHSPGDIRAALVGRRLTTVHRRGKTLWCDTSSLGAAGPPGSALGPPGSALGPRGSALGPPEQALGPPEQALGPPEQALGPPGQALGPPGPALGIHLGMSGKIVITDGRGREVEGGDYWGRGRAIGDYRFRRFSLTFADGGSLLLVDPRRLGRVRLDPPVETLGPDALEITPKQFRAAFSKGTAPVKARLLDQSAIAGIGNLLADQILWQAKIHPARPVGELSPADVDRLLRAVRRTVKAAVAGGGVHILPVIAFRTHGAACPRCGALMAHGTVGGRTTWWCPREQI